MRNVVVRTPSMLMLDIVRLETKVRSKTLMGS